MFSIPGRIGISDFFFIDLRQNSVTYLLFISHSAFSFQALAFHPLIVYLDALTVMRSTLHLLLMTLVRTFERIMCGIAHRTM